MYSWRVLILPQWEQKELYDQFHLDEPWDSSHNAQFIERMPMIYAPPGSKKSLAPPGHTFIQVFVGNGTAFDDTRFKSLNDFDSTSSTILVIQGGKAVPWTKPDDIPYSPDEPLPELATVFKDGFRALYADGSVRFVKKNTPESELRAAIAPSLRESSEPMK